MFLRKQTQLIVVVATRQRDALATLAAVTDVPVTRREALTTDGLYRALSGAHLAIVDLADVAESTGLDRARMAAVLANLLTATGADFAARPTHYLDQARAASGLSGALPARCVALAGLSGGVGKSTLALSLARYFRHKTGLPAAVIELSTGPSGLLALLARDDQAWPHLYEVVSQAKTWPIWEGVTLGGMAWETARLLTDAQILAAWRTITDQHILTVIDAPAYHPAWPLAQQLADRVLYVADGRADALANAVWLLSQDDDKGSVLLNRGGLAARVALPQAPVIDLPDVGRSASTFGPELGRRLMPIIYPGWKA